MAQEGQQERSVKFLLDECLPHEFAKRLAARVYPDAVLPIHLGLRTSEDHLLVRRALEQDRIIITANADDFRRQLSRELVHSGLILLPNASRDTNWLLLEIALAFIELHPDPAGTMVNRVIEVSATDGIRPYELPKGE